MTQIDNSKASILARPTFRDAKEEREHLEKRFIDLAREESMPPLPTRQQELQYLDWLESSLGKDTFLNMWHMHYEAGPHRMERNYRKDLRKDYEKRFIFNGLILVGALSPLILYLSRRRMYSSFTGVPKGAERLNQFLPMYRLMAHNDNFMTIRSFKYGLFAYSTLAFLAGGFLMTDNSFSKDISLTRPDFNGYRPMVSKEYVPVQEIRQVESVHGSYFDGLLEGKKSFLARTKAWLWPELVYNPTASDFVPYSPTDGDFRTKQNDFHYHK